MWLPLAGLQWVHTSRVSLEMLEHKTDTYGGVIVRSSLVPMEEETFADELASSLNTWRGSGVRGVWLRILADRTHLLPVALAQGMELHSACPAWVQVTAWLDEGAPSSLPPPPAFKFGMAGFVTHKDHVLLIQEASGPASAYPGFWKLPGGNVDPDEELLDAAEREVLEETGIVASALGLVGIRHAVGSTGDRPRPADLYGVAYMPLDPEAERPELDLEKGDGEVADITWMPIAEYLSLPHVKGIYKDLYTLAANYHAQHSHQFTAAGSESSSSPPPSQTPPSSAGSLASSIPSLAPPVYGGLIEAKEGPIGFRPGTNTLLQARL